MRGITAHLEKSPTKSKTAPPASASTANHPKKFGKNKFKLSLPPGPRKSANLSIFGFPLSQTIFLTPATQKI